MMSSLIALATAQAVQAPAQAEPQVQPPAIRPVPLPSPPRVIFVPPAPPLSTPRPATPATRPRLIAGTIVPEDYPAAAIRAGEEGSTRVRFTVEPTGRVSGCTVTESSGSSALDSASCQLITRRFRFRPATRDGVPVAGAVIQRVTWRLPEEPLIQFAQGRFTWTVTASPTGTTACDLTVDGAAFRQFDEDNCRVPAEAWLVAEEDLEPGHPPVRVTQVLSLLPQGEALTLPRLPGTPFWEEVAEIDIAADGTVTSCTPVSEHGELPDYAGGRFQPLCERLTAGKSFAVAPEGETRRARMQSALYVEVLQPGRR